MHEKFPGGGGGGGGGSLIQRSKGNFIMSHQELKLFIVVGEPKSRIVQKHTFFAPERYTAGNLYTDSLNSAGYETTV